MATCDPKTLPAQATCFRCIDRGQLDPINLFILWTATGDGLTASQVATLATPFRPFDHHQYLAAKAYLMAVITGSSTTPATLVKLAACYFCIPKSERRNIETFLLAAGAGLTTNPATLSANSAQFRGVEQYQESELYFLAQLAGGLTPAQVMTGANCFRCLSNDQLDLLAIYFECIGLAANIIPPGSTYGPGSTFTIAILPNTFYKIQWGANDVSANVCGTVYTSTGAGTSTNFYSGSCTTLILTGNASGTTVTAMVTPVHNVNPPPSKFAFSIIPSGQLTASWDTPPATVSATQLWTSTDGTNYTLQATVAAPGTSTTIANQNATGPVYAKALWVYNIGPSGFTSALTVQGRVADWAGRVVTNGGAQVSQATINALSTFVASLVSNGLDSLMMVLNPIAPDNLTAAITPLYKAAGSDPWTNHNFVAGDLTVNGLAGDAATKFLDTGFTQSSWAAVFAGVTCRNSAGLVLYFSVTNANSQYDFGIGAQANALQQMTGLANQSGTAEFDDPLGTGNSLRVSVANANWTGYLSGQRISSTDARLYKASSIFPHAQIAINNNAAGATGVDAGNFYLFALNEVGLGAQFFSSKRISFVAAVAGLTSAQDTTLYNATQALRVAFGGGFV